MISSFDIQDPTIVFECSNIKEDMGLLLLENKEGKLELHLHNDYTTDAMMMTVDIKDFARMCQALEEYFQRTGRDLND